MSTVNIGPGIHATPARRACVVQAGDLAAAPAAPGCSAAVRTAYDAGEGCPHLEQRLLELAGPGPSAPRSPGACDEVLFVLSGHGLLHLDGVAHALEPECGAYIRPGETYELERTGADPLVVHSVTVPEPPSDVPCGERRVVVRLAEQDARNATGAREFRCVTDPQVGCPSVTQFVGYIPPGRAPDHFHTYDEVIVVLEGEGELHIGDVHEPLRAGSCIHLTPRLVHSLENHGPGTMRVLGIFRPAGSPAEAYYPNGDLAYNYRDE